MALVDKIVEWYQKAGNAKRLGRVIDESAIGFAMFILKPVLC